MLLYFLVHASSLLAMASAARVVGGSVWQSLHLYSTGPSTQAGSSNANSAQSGDLQVCYFDSNGGKSYQLLAAASSSASAPTATQLTFSFSGKQATNELLTISLHSSSPLPSDAHVALLPPSSDCSSNTQTVAGGTPSSEVLTSSTQLDATFQVSDAYSDPLTLCYSSTSSSVTGTAVSSTNSGKLRVTATTYTASRSPVIIGAAATLTLVTSEFDPVSITINDPSNGCQQQPLFSTKLSGTFTTDFTINSAYTTGFAGTAALPLLVCAGPSGEESAIAPNVVGGDLFLVGPASYVIGDASTGLLGKAAAGRLTTWLITGPGLPVSSDLIQVIGSDVCSGTPVSGGSEVTVSAVPGMSGAVTAQMQFDEASDFALVCYSTDGGDTYRSLGRTQILPGYYTWSVGGSVGTSPVSYGVPVEITVQSNVFTTGTLTVYQPGNGCSGEVIAGGDAQQVQVGVASKFTFDAPSTSSSGYAAVLCLDYGSGAKELVPDAAPLSISQVSYSFSVNATSSSVQTSSTSSSSIFDRFAPSPSWPRIGQSVNVSVIGASGDFSLSAAAADSSCTNDAFSSQGPFSVAMGSAVSMVFSSLSSSGIALGPWTIGLCYNGAQIPPANLLVPLGVAGAVSYAVTPATAILVNSSFTVTAFGALSGSSPPTVALVPVSTACSLLSAPTTTSTVSATPSPTHVSTVTGTATSTARARTVTLVQTAVSRVVDYLFALPTTSADVTKAAFSALGTSNATVLVPGTNRAGEGWAIRLVVVVPSTETAASIVAASLSSRALSALSLRNVFVDPVCGNSKREGVEVCDDGNLRTGDGCGGLCAVEAGWACDRNNFGNLSTCRLKQDVFARATFWPRDPTPNVPNVTARFADLLYVDNTDVSVQSVVRTAGKERLRGFQAAQVAPVTTKTPTPTPTATASPIFPFFAANMKIFGDPSMRNSIAALSSDSVLQSYGLRSVQAVDSPSPPPVSPPAPIPTTVPNFSPPFTATPEPDSGGGLTTGAKVGIAVGTVAGTAVVVAVVAVVAVTTGVVGGTSTTAAAAGAAGVGAAVHNTAGNAGAAAAIHEALQTGGQTGGKVAAKSSGRSIFKTLKDVWDGLQKGKSAVDRAKRANEYRDIYNDGGWRGVGSGLVTDARGEAVDHALDYGVEFLGGYIPGLGAIWEGFNTANDAREYGSMAREHYQQRGKKRGVELEPDPSLETDDVDIEFDQRNALPRQTWDPRTMMQPAHNPIRFASSPHFAPQQYPFPYPPLHHGVGNAGNPYYGGPRGAQYYFR